ncbi:hypothetical protein [Tenacibaculum maritimum]|uniref:hypothetical protein n=1 Tax=Tenacibaculum maritimum TaxID=107401 RepID=UPI001E4A24D6|nr:hypothetical protein [Tenacibaculum maritimum]
MNNFLYHQLLDEISFLKEILLILLGLLLLVIIRNWYNLYRKRSFRKKNKRLEEELKKNKEIILDHKAKIEKIKKEHVRLQGLEKEQEEKKYKAVCESLREQKLKGEEDIRKLKEIIESQKKSYERYVDFKTVEANNTRLGAHFIKNIISQVYQDLEEAESGYKTFLRIQYRTLESKEKMLPMKVLKNIFKLLDYNVSSLRKENVTIQEELAHIEMFLDLIKYLKPNTKILFENSLKAAEKNNIKIKPTLFFPFIENALKHGSLNDQSSFINIELKKNQKKELSYSLLNSAEYKPNNKKDNGESSKFGLKSLKELIDLYYKGSTMECFPIQSSKYLAKLILVIK